MELSGSREDGPFFYANDETPVPLGKGSWKSSKSRWSL
jgi:hypothetical protein